MNSKNKEMVTNSKNELETKEEKTQQARYFKPATDILETEHNLVLYMDMPGVSKKSVEVKLEKNLLNVEGQIDQSRYEPLKAQYAEYNIGHFTRSFQISSEIDREKIHAEMDNGVLTLTLPKAEEAKPQTIAIN